MLKSERQSLYRFLTLYGLLVLIVATLVAVFYYRSRQELMLSRAKAQMMGLAEIQIRRLKHLHHHFPEENRYPRDPRFRSAIYDLEHVRIFSTLHEPAVDFLGDVYRRGAYIHYVKLLSDYYLGAKYLFIEIPVDQSWMRATWLHIAAGMFAALLLLGLAGLYLARLFVRPMRRSIELLDAFIHDTTHELNTPLATILGNIETMEGSCLPQRERKKLQRIETAAKTVATLYEDLKFLTLERQRPVEDRIFDLRDLIRERLEYFAPMIRSKELTVSSELDEAPILADRRLMARVLDNLLSNAVKYNRRGGRIEIQLLPGVLRIRDTGIGMDEETRSKIFQRYVRGASSEGGFGLGLNIVRTILDRYGFDIEVLSTPGEGSIFTIRWELPS